MNVRNVVMRARLFDFCSPKYHMKRGVMRAHLFHLCSAKHHKKCGNEGAFVSFVFT